MKTLKVIVCALFVLCGSLVLAACGKAQEFDVNKIYVGTLDEFIYDGKSHAISIDYDGVGANVTYALSTDKNNFMQLKDLPTKNVGTYNLYYKLSAKGYNDYISTGTLEMTVLPRTLEIIIEDYTLIKSDIHNGINFGYMTIGVVEGDDVGLQYNFGEEFDEETIEYGDVYDINWSITNSNYTLVADQAKLYVKDFAELKDAQGETKGYYTNIQDAIDNAVAGETVVLNSNVALNNTVRVNNSVTIDGQGLYTVLAKTNMTKDSYDGKEVASLFNIVDDGVELTLRDVTLNGSKVVRGVSAFKGKVVIENATIYNGKKTDKWRSGGVYITNAASFEMTGGSITGNDANDTSYTKYCADLWVGANANGTLCAIEGGEVGNVFVNSNSYSNLGAGKFMLNGGIVENVYVEYDSGYGANFEYITGDIAHLLVSLKNEQGNFYGVYQEIPAVESTTYVGGKLVYTETETEFTGNTYNENIDDLLVDGNNYVFENCVFNTAVNTTKKVGIIFNNCTFTATANEGETCLYLTSVSNLVVNNCTFNGVTTGGYALDVNLYSNTCENIIVANNVFNTINTDTNGVISIKTRLGSTDHPLENWAQNQAAGKIYGQVVIAGNNFADNTLIEIGTKPQGNSTTANTTTGNFDVAVMYNAEAVTIYNMFKDSAHVTEENSSKVTIQANGVYTSAN